jgi:putative flippase GtrA
VSQGRPDRVSELVRTLRSPDSGLLGQGARFAIAGATVWIVSTSVTLGLAAGGLPFEAALAIGFSVGLVVHFTLQRFFVWVHHEDFALAFHHQLGRYLAVAATQYATLAAATGILPGLVGLPDSVVYLATMATIVCLNFLVFRNGVFHAKD